jgi:uncharacterized Zn finger protein
MEVEDWNESWNGKPVVIRTKEQNLYCPDCGLEGVLKKKADTGEGVKHCGSCGAGWFLLKTSRGKT